MTLCLAAFRKSDLLWPMNVSGMTPRFNFDGLLHFTTSDPPKTRSYVQIFHYGAIEAVEATRIKPDAKLLIISSPSFEETLLRAVTNYLSALRECGLEPPIFVMVSLLGVKNGSLRRERVWAGDVENMIIDRDILLLPDAVVESFDVEAATILRNAFNAVWRASGYAYCVHYEDEGKGKWAPKR